MIKLTTEKRDYLLGHLKLLLMEVIKITEYDKTNRWKFYSMSVIWINDIKKLFEDLGEINASQIAMKLSSLRNVETNNFIPTALNFIKKPTRKKLRYAAVQVYLKETFDLVYETYYQLLLNGGNGVNNK